MEKKTLDKDDFETINKFNSRFLLLQDTEVYKFLAQNKRIEASWNEKKGFSQNYPQEELIKGFVTCFRIFFLKGEGITPEDMNNIYKKYNYFDNNDLKDSFEYILLKFNEEKKQDSFRTIKKGELEERFSNWDLINIYMYGHVLHENEDKKEKYDILNRDKINHHLFLAKVFGSFANFLAVITNIYLMNLYILKHDC